jgi:hypothetical protein
MKMDERERNRRNLHPHAEARLAMALWSHEYAHEQRGGSMDFWDSIGPQRRRLCVSIMDEVLGALETDGRAQAEVKAA